MLRRRCDDAGIEHINPHRFRHTWAHEFRAQGGSEGDLMYLAGWSSTAMAHRYGSSAAAERAQQAARALSLGDRL
jgi:integrase